MYVMQLFMNQAIRSSLHYGRYEAILLFFIISELEKTKRDVIFLEYFVFLSNIARHVYNILLWLTCCLFFRHFFS